MRMLWSVNMELERPSNTTAPYHDLLVLPALLYLLFSGMGLGVFNQCHFALFA